jgi:hypothetical protein
MVKRVGRFQFENTIENNKKKNAIGDFSVQVLIIPGFYGVMGFIF